MKLHLLGSSGGKPVPRPFCNCRGCQVARKYGGHNYRTRTAMNIYLSGQGPSNMRYKVDHSPDTAHHIIRFKLDMTALEHLLITHAHYDHLDPYFLSVRRQAISGVDDMKQLNIYGGVEVEECLQARIPDFSVCKITFHRVKAFEWVRIGQLDVFPLLANHICPSESFNYIVRAEGSTALLGWDTGIWSEDTWDAVSDFCFDAVFLECSVIGPKGKYIGPDHHDLNTFFAMKTRMEDMHLIRQDAPFVAVHIGDNGLVSHEEAQQIMTPHHVVVGYDGLILDV